MQNYYEILQVNKNASKEVIDKAYRVLAKQYHPDANVPEKKVWAEEMFKSLNTAYEVLSDEEKRKAYDLEIEEKTQTVNEEAFEQLEREKEQLKQQVEHLKYIQKEQANEQILYNNEEPDETKQEEPRRNLQDEIYNVYRKAYQDAYIQNLKDRGYTIKYKRTIKDYLAVVLTFAIIIAVGYILWCIPFSKKLLIQLYEQNSVVHETVNFIIAIIQSFTK